MAFQIPRDEVKNGISYCNTNVLDLVKPSAMIPDEVANLLFLTLRPMGKCMVADSGRELFSLSPPG